MKFINIINQKKFILISILMFFYIAINLIDGERGLISYYEKQKIKEELIIQKQNLSGKLAIIEKKNYEENVSILTKSKIDKDKKEKLKKLKEIANEKMRLKINTVEKIDSLILNGKI